MANKHPERAEEPFRSILCNQFYVTRCVRVMPQVTKALEMEREETRPRELINRFRSLADASSVIRLTMNLMRAALLYI